jgi:ATP-binding cassette, subfamily B, multidrug efflux pump
MKSLSLIKPYFIENRLTILLGVCCLVVVDFLQLLIPRIIKWTVDDITSFRIEPAGLLAYAGYIVGIAGGIAIFRYGWRRCLIGTSRIVEEGLRNKLFFHIQTLSASYFQRVKTGDLMAHGTNDIQHIRMATGMGLVALTDSLVLGTAAVGFMAYINVRLTLLVLIPMPLIVLASRLYSRRMHLNYQTVQGAFSELTEIVRERFAGIRIIKAYNSQAAETAKLEDVSLDFIRKNLKLVRLIGSFFPIMVFFSNLSLVFVLYFGGRETIDTTITPGDFVAFISYLGLLTWPMMALGWVINLIQRGRASLDRIDAILETRPEIADSPDSKPLEKTDGRIDFQNVMFAYGPRNAPELAQISFNLGQGETLGIVGPPGSGKSTILKLIPRIHDVSGGRILIDGSDARDIRLSDLRSSISFVPQEPFLFAGTIRNNITSGLDIDDADLIRAAKEASLYSTIEAFSDGFDTLIGEKGVILSGGQKQRVALARALLNKKPIILLDDPISQVDMETGSTIIETLKGLAAGRTVMIVSHRLSAVRYADKILSLDGGRIVEAGTHEALMVNNGYYAKTFRLQEIEEHYQTAGFKPGKG